MPTHRTEYLLTAKDKTGGAFKSAAGNMKKVGRAAAIAGTAIAAMSAAAVAIVKNQANATRSTRAYADALGVSIENMSRFEHAFSIVGIEAEKSGDILKDVAEKIGDAYANNAGEAKESLEALGISIAEINQLTPDQQLFRIAEGLEQIGTRGEKIQILEALANDASKLLPLLDDNAAGLRELAAEADATGRTLTSMEADALAKSDRALKRLDASFIALKQTMAVELSAPIENVIGWFNDWIPAALRKAEKAIEFLTAAWSTMRRGFSGEDTSGKSAAQIFEEELERIRAASDQARMGLQVDLQPPPEDPPAWQFELDARVLAVERAEQEIESIMGTAAERRLRFTSQTWAAQTKIIAGELVSITRGVAHQNRALFEINKTAGIATAIINAHQGASESLKAYPMPLAGVMAAIHYAAGIAQVNAIRSASYNGGGGGSSPSSSSPVPTPPSDFGTAPNTNQPAGPQINIQVDGNVFANEAWREALVEQMRVALDNDEIDF